MALKVRQNAEAFNPNHRQVVIVPFALAERCVPLARNVMCPSGVMFASQVMRAAAREERNTSHRFAPKAQYITMAKP